MDTLLNLASDLGDISAEEERGAPGDLVARDGLPEEREGPERDEDRLRREVELGRLARRTGI